MRRLKQLLRPLPATPTDNAPTSPNPPPTKGFLTIGGTTYIDPHGTYPLAHHLDGSATLIINETDHYITVVTERDHDYGRDHHDPPPVPPARGTQRDLVLAPGERAETWRGDSVRVG
ncbi:hypothetical protein [Streptomyces tubercidicus]|uniref:hypothetical protein n=1 Tax=Streptomyces tubercidicus TaxID=47759 RepID=UPI0036A2A1B8